MNNIVFISLSQDELRNIIKDSIREEMNLKKEKELLNFKETTEFLGCSPSFLNKAKSENRIPYKKLGKRVFFDRQEVREAMKESNYFKLKELQ